MNSTVKQSKALVGSSSKADRISQMKGYWSRHWMLYVMLLPPVAFFFVFNYMPMVNILIAFSPNNVVLPVLETGWVGFANFETAFSNHIFMGAIRNTIMFSVLDLVVGFPAPIILALLLNELKFERFKKITQTITYMPHFLSWVIMGGMAVSLFSTNSGAVNNLIVGMGGEAIPFIETPVYWTITNVLMSMWRSVGWNTIIYLAAITNISPEYYEAAEMDGASRLRKMWHITLPGIRPVIVTLLVLTMGGILNADLSRFIAMDNAFVRTVSEVIPTFVYRWGLQSMQFSLAGAIGIFQSVIGMTLLLFSNWLVKKLGGNGFW
ncbi:MAG: ABC transporter permease subunit [Turicibacter sp.]|nr:ABC transporter permease subunit [Turicibacter sp.]